MATQPYNEILKRAQAELSVQEQNQLSAELAQSAARDRNGKRRSLLELEGLGKEIWKGIDPDEYIAQERDSWDG